MGIEIILINNSFQFNDINYIQTQRRAMGTKMASTNATLTLSYLEENQYKELPFLDILIKNENGQIITDIYHKSTDTQHHLYFKSHHPQNCIKSIPLHSRT